MVEVFQPVCLVRIFKLLNVKFECVVGEQTNYAVATLNTHTRRINRDIFKQEEIYKENSKLTRNNYEN